MMENKTEAMNYDSYRNKMLEAAREAGMSEDDLNAIVSLEFNGSQIYELAEAVKAGLDIHSIVNPEYNAAQMLVMRTAMENGMDIGEINKPDLHYSIGAELADKYLSEKDVEPLAMAEKTVHKGLDALITGARNRFDKQSAGEHSVSKVHDVSLNK